MSTDYQIWIEHDGIRDMLPMNPPEITVKLSGNNKSVNIIDLGEAVVPQIPKAKEISFSGFFPKHYTQGMNYPPSSRVMPKYFVTLFMQLMEKKTVVRLCVTGCGFFWNCIVDDFTCSESGGDVGTFDYTVKFKEYISPKMQKININGNYALGTQSKKPSRVITKPAVKTYTTKQGETLYTIGKQLYGDGEYGKAKLFTSNRKIIGNNPNISLNGGLVLKVPQINF